MTLRLLARRSLGYYFRAHLGVLAGAALAATVLIGALAVGDSVRGSLKARAWQRVGVIAAAVRGGDRFFQQDLLFRDKSAAAALSLPATITRQDGTARANHVTVLGVRLDAALLLNLPLPGQSLEQQIHNVEPSWAGQPPGFFGHQRLRDVLADNLPPAGTVTLNAALASALKVKRDDSLILRLHKPSALSRDAVITPRDDQSVALRVKVRDILKDGVGNFSLDANQTVPFNVFIDMDTLALAAGLPHRANLLLYAEGPKTDNPPSIRWLRAIAPHLTKTLGRQADNWASDLEIRELFEGPVHYNTAASQFDTADALLKTSWTLADAELSVRAVAPDPKLTGGEPAPAFAELTTRRIFLEPAVVTAALTNATASGGPGSIPAVDLLSAAGGQSQGAGASATSPVPILTYLVNTLSHGDELAPYSMVTAAGAPYTPAGMGDDEIVVNEWLAKDLGVKPGDTVALGYYRVDAGTQLVERTNNFRVHSIVPMRGLHADRSLMPEFPGLTKAESTRDWDAGFDLVHPIRDADEAYWKQWRGTPKAFITLAAGQKIWANRFGDLTAIRWFAGTNQVAALRDGVAAKIRANLDPADVGLRFTDVRTPALAAAEGGTGKEFGGLMIGFSFFLITSALLLTAMLFSFSLGQRASETGILLAIGWEPRRVRSLLFREGFMVATLGTALGVAGGILYAKGVLWGLSTLWRDAVNGAGLGFHITAATLATGVGSSLFVAAATLWLVLRQQAKRPTRELLSEGAAEPSPVGADPGARWPMRLAVGTSIAAFGMTAAAGAARSSDPGMFFGAGALLLIAGLLWVRAWLRGAIGSTARTGSAIGRAARAPVGLTALAFRGLKRRPSRSLGTAALLASAAFLIIAVGANTLDANRDATKRDSGTGGFALWAESSLPVIQDLDTRKGQEFYGLDPKKLTGVSFVPFKVRDGDDASCLNLNRAQRPRLLGVKPELLARRGAFTFTGLAKDAGVTNGWDAIRAKPSAPGSEVPVIPAIADANSIQWALQMQLGDTLDYVDERGRPFKVRLVGAVANSVLQGSLVIDEAEFVRRFPSESGSRAFLIDVAAEVTRRNPADTNPPPHVGGYDELSADLTRALQDTGLEITSAPKRLAMFNAVQNTYLDTFQMLGGLGLLLGSVGLGVVVLRNVFERRGELAVMQAVGFERSALQRFVLVEHAALLVLGLGVGTVAAGVAVLPALLSPGAQVPWTSLAITLLAVLLNGGLWTWLATRRALGGSLVGSLRAL